MQKASWEHDKLSQYPITWISDSEGSNVILVCPRRAQIYPNAFEAVRATSKTLIEFHLLTLLHHQIELPRYQPQISPIVETRGHWQRKMRHSRRLLRHLWIKVKRVLLFVIQQQTKDRLP